MFMGDSASSAAIENRSKPSYWEASSGKWSTSDECMLVLRSSWICSRLDSLLSDFNRNSVLKLALNRAPPLGWGRKLHVFWGLSSCFKSIHLSFMVFLFKMINYYQIVIKQTDSKNRFWQPYNIILYWRCYKIIEGIAKSIVCATTCHALKAASV